MIKPYKVGIIGAGNIGAQFDAPNSSDVLTHAHAYSLHPGFEICGFVDKDYKQAKAAARKWGGQAYSKLPQLISNQRPQIVSVCTPDDTHTMVVKQLRDSGILGGILEKPLADSLSHAQTLVKALPPAGKFLVNYSRMFVPEFINLQNQIVQGKYGKFLTGTGYYGKGLLHNGSHLIGLLVWFFGPIRLAKKINQINDFTTIDPSFSAVLTFKAGGQCTIQAVDCKYYSLFELDLLFERARVKMTDSGFKITTYKLADNVKFTGYRSLIQSQTITTSFNRSLELTVKNLFDWLARSKLPLSTVHNALEILKACSLIINPK